METEQLNVYPNWREEIPTESFPKRKGDWAGRYVILTRNFHAGSGHIFPEGLLLRVDRNYGGVHCDVISNCPSCGIGHRYSILVPERALVLVAYNWEPLPSRVYKGIPLVGIPLLPLDPDFKQQYGSPIIPVFSFLA